MSGFQRFKFGSKIIEILQNVAAVGSGLSSRNCFFCTLIKINKFKDHFANLYIYIYIIVAVSLYSKFKRRLFLVDSTVVHEFMDKWS